MDAIPLFLNDGSYPSNADGQEAQEEILKLLRTLKSVKALNRPFVVGMAVPLSEVTFTKAYHTLAAYAAIDKEWWRFIKTLDQRCPFSSVPQCVPPEAGAHIVANGAMEATAPLWALKNASFIVSFPTRVELQQNTVEVAVCLCRDGLHNSRSFCCRNLSTPAHVDVWRDALLDFNYVEAASSTIYECHAYRLKMYLRDHDPPHVHVYQLGDLRTCVGRVRFDFVEIMENNGFSGSVKKDVLALLESKREVFLRAWDRCRAGNLPNRIDP